MKFYVAEARWRHEGVFLDALTATAQIIGHEWVTEPGDADLLIQWGTRPKNDRPTLYAECGWLPRWEYQLSHTGINAEHHRAPLEPIELMDVEQLWKVRNHLDRIRKGTDAPPWGYLDIAQPPIPNIERPFLLGALQMEDDTNMDAVPEYMRTNQNFVDWVSRWRDRNHPDVPILFKQHPNTQARYQLGLAMRHAGDNIVPHTRGHVYAYLKHEHCAGVLTANSNVANDALLWDVPTRAFGRGIWPEYIFGRSLKWWSDTDNQRLRRRYIYALMRAQWRLSDAQDARRVHEAIEEAVR